MIRTVDEILNEAITEYIVENEDPGGDLDDRISSKKEQWFVNCSIK